MYILVENPEWKDAQYEMRYYNAAGDVLSRERFKRGDDGKLIPVPELIVKETQDERHTKN